MAALSQEPKQLPPHVLVFPFPAQGHLNPMLNLANLLSLSGLHVTFIVSESSHRRLLRDSAAAFAPDSGFQFQPIPDGLPDDHPRTWAEAVHLPSTVNNTMVPLVKKMIQDGFFASASRRPVTCVIADGLLGFPADFEEETGIPLVHFRSAGAGYFWTCFRLPELIGAGETPCEGTDMDELVKGVPGMEGFLRRRDLPSFFRPDDEGYPILQSLAVGIKQIVRAQAAIFNTFEDLEEATTSEIRKYAQRTFTIGPMHAHLKSKLTAKNLQTSILSGGFWTEDRTCMDWLNAQVPKSVIYVSFGSITFLTKEQLLEVWHGLVNSKQQFLWVMRPNFTTREDGETKIPGELMEGTKKGGFIVDWAPQDQVLNHQSVGGFLTHSGWNSTLESIVAGVPMICWPRFGDQMVNSRLVSEVWKLGLDIKDTCDRLIVENAVQELMELRKDEFQERAQLVQKLAQKAVSQGGSSYSNLESFLAYINSLII